MTPEDHDDITPEEHYNGLLRRVSLIACDLYGVLHNYGPDAVARAAETMVSDDDDMHPASVAMIRDGARAMAEREQGR